MSDGSRRPVYRDAEGRQYVLDNTGCPVLGGWLWRGGDGTDFGDWFDVPVAFEIRPTRGAQAPKVTEGTDRSRNRWNSWSR